MWGDPYFRFILGHNDLSGNIETRKYGASPRFPLRPEFVSSPAPSPRTQLAPGTTGSPEASLYGGLQLRYSVASLNIPRIEWCRNLDEAPPASRLQCRLEAGATAQITTLPRIGVFRWHGNNVVDWPANKNHWSTQECREREVGASLRVEHRNIVGVLYRAT
jgi:hypothetical protein